MSKLKQLIALQTSNLSVRELALRLSIGAVSKYQRAVRAAGHRVAEAENQSEAELEQRVFGPAQPVKAGALVAPDCAWAARHAEGRIHFAREHTSAWGAYQNGALESAERCVQEVLQADGEVAEQPF